MPLEGTKIVTPSRVILESCRRRYISVYSSLRDKSRLIRVTAKLNGAMAFDEVTQGNEILLLSRHRRLIARPIGCCDYPMNVRGTRQRSRNRRIISTSIRALTGQLRESFRPNRFSVIVASRTRRTLTPSCQGVCSCLEPHLRVKFATAPEEKSSQNLKTIFSSVIFRGSLH